MGKKFRKYGLMFEKQLPPAMLEINLYSSDEWREMTEGRCLSKEEHMINAIEELFPRRIFDVNPFSKRIIEAWCQTNSVVIWGPSACAKSGTAAMIALIDLYADLANTLTRMVTNPLSEHGNRTYGSFKKWYQYLPKIYRQFNFRDNPVMGMPTIKDGQAAGVVCFSNKAGDSEEDLKRKLGAHQLRNRLFGDEIQGCSDAVLNIKVNMGASHEYKEMFLGNPDTWFGALGKASLPKYYDRSYIDKEEPDEWVTKATIKGKEGRCLVLDGRKCPSLEEPEKYPYMLQPDHFKEIIEQYGEDSPFVWTYIIGRIPPGGFKHVVVSESDLIKFEVHREPQWVSAPTNIAAGDFAPQGGDDNCLRLMQIGQEVGGNFVLHSKALEYLKINVKIPDKSLQIAKQTVALLKKWGVGADRFVADSTGTQGPLIDTIEREMGASGAYRIDSAGRASDRPIGNNQKAKDRYKNRATEMLMTIERLATQSQLTGLDDRTCSQISTRECLLSEGRQQAEEKKLWRARHQGKSPDELDCLVLGCVYAIETGILPVGGTSARDLAHATSSTWEEKKKLLDYRHRIRRGGRQQVRARR